LLSGNKDDKMSSLIYNPAEFLNEEIIFMSLRLIAAAVVAVLGFSAFRVIRDRKYMIFGIGFTLISSAFMFKLISYLFFIKNEVCNGCEGYTWFFVFYYVFVLAYLVGATALALLYIKIDDSYVMAFIGLLLLLTSFVSLTSFAAFSGFLGLIFGFVAMRAFEYYMHAKSRPTIMIFSSFAAVSLSQFIRALGDMLFVSSFILVGELLSLAGFLLLAYVLLRVYNK